MPGGLPTPRAGFRPRIPLKPAGTRPGPGGSGAGGKAGVAGGAGHGGAGARTAADETGGRDAVGNAVRGTGSGQPGGELVEVRLADEDGAGVEQAGDRRRMGDS